MIRLRRNRVINFSAFELWQLNILFGEGRIKFRTLFLKVLKLPEFLRSGASLFHSAIVDGKNEFLKNLWRNLKNGILSAFLVVYDEGGGGGGGGY